MYVCTYNGVYVTACTRIYVYVYVCTNVNTVDLSCRMSPYQN